VGADEASPSTSGAARASAARAPGAARLPAALAAVPVRPIVLPRLGSVDQMLLEGQHHVSLFRTRARSYFLERAMECRRHHEQGDTWVEAALDVSLKGGVFRLLGVHSIQVKRGSPLNEATRNCMVAQFQQPIVLPPPPPPPEAPPEQRAKYDGKWGDLPDLEGDVIVEAGFGDNACSPDGAKAPPPAPGG
jgi:hypothetical protein